MAKTAPRSDTGESGARPAAPSLFAARSRDGTPGDGADAEAEAEAAAGSEAEGAEGSEAEGSAGLTLAQLARAVGVDVEHVAELQRLGIVAPAAERSGADDDGDDGPRFDRDALLVARTAAALADHGLPARNLRMFKVAADREAGVYEQLLGPLIARGDAGRLRAELAEIVDLTESLRRRLLQRAMRPHLD